MITVIISFIVANSEIIIPLAILIFGGLVALISKNRQKAFTKLYGLCVEAENLGLSNIEKNSWVFNKAYSILPIYIRAFVSADAIRYAIEFALKNLKKFSKLKMGVTPELVLLEREKNVETVNKVIDVIQESKEQISEVIEDVKNTIDVISETPIKEIIGNISTEKFLSDIKDNKNAGDIIEDIVEQLPTNLGNEIKDICENVNESKEVIENIVEVVKDIKENEDLNPIIDKIEIVANPVLEKLEDVKEIVGDKIDEVKEVVQPVLTSVESESLK